MDTKEIEIILMSYKKRLLSFEKILIVGGTGFIGYHLACKLLKKWSILVYLPKKQKK